MSSAATIPTDLKYEEKLLGPLNVKQSIMVTAIGATCFLVWRYLSYGIYVKAALLVPLSITALLIAFFDLDTKAKSYARYILSKKSVSWLSPKIKDFMCVEDIKNDSAYTSDNRLLGVIRIDPIDFLVLPEEHRDRVISGFRRFLNSLSFPIQILMRSVSLDIDGHLNNLKDTAMKSKDEQKIKYFNHYSEFLKRVVQEADVANREFYIVVPTNAKGKDGDRLNELETDCNRVIHGLSSAGIPSRRLDTHELKGLYGNFFEEQFKVGEQYMSPITIYNNMDRLDEIERIMRDNSHVSESDPMHKNMIRLSSEDIKHEDIIFGIDEKALVQMLVTPEEVRIYEREVKIDKYHRVLCGINYPRQVDAGWLADLIAMKADLNISIHISPYSRKTAVSLLNNQIKKLETDIYWLKSTGKIIPPSLTIQRDDMVSLLTNIEAGTEKIFDIGFYVDVKAHNTKDLDIATKKVRNIMESIMIQPKVPALQMRDAVQSCLPIAMNKLGPVVNRCMTSSSAAACFPFITSSLQESGGTLFGFNQLNDIPVIIDPFSHPNFNILCLGTSGGGKSFAIKLLAMRQYTAGTDVYIIDPQGEYSEMVKSLGGDIIRISPDSDQVINPMDMMGMTYDEKKLSLYSFFAVMLGGELTEPQKAVLDECIDAAFDKKGITQDPVTWSKKPPKLEDVYDALEPKLKDRREMIYMPALAVYNRLKTYVHGPLRFLNRETTVDINKRLISFDVSEIEQGKGKKAVLYLVLEFIYKKMKQNRRRKMVIIDEAWSVLSSMSGEDDDYITRIVKTARKFNLSLCMISQEVNDFLRPIPGSRIPRGESVFANTSIKLLLKQDPTVVNSVVDYFNLTDGEKDYLVNAQPGNVLFMAQEAKIPVFVLASPEEKVLVTTNADEILARTLPPERVEPEKDFSVRRAMHYQKALNGLQISALEKLGFGKVVDPGFSQSTGEILYIKNDSGESDGHYIVKQLIHNELEKLRESVGFDHYKMRLNMHRMNYPDISFYTQDDKFVAIEVVDIADVPLGNLRESGDVGEEVLRKLEKEDGCGSREDAFLTKMEQKKGYAEWIMVCVRQDIANCLDGYGNVLLRTDVPTKLRRLLKCQKSAGLLN